MDPVFSIVVLVADQSAHMLPFTMDSILSQSLHSYEIILVDGRTSKHNQRIFNDYRQYFAKFICSEKETVFAQLNEAVGTAKGKYVHFLMTGEFYLFSHALAIIEEKITGDPEIIYSGYLLRHSLSPVQIQVKEMTIEDLKTGRFSSTLQPYWFSLKSLRTLNGFNERFSMQAGFDLVCRYFLNPKCQKVFLSRVLTDYEYVKAPSKKVIRQFVEMLFLLWVHFGVSRSLFSWVAKNYLRLLQWWVKNIKIAFWRRPAL